MYSWRGRGGAGVQLEREKRSWCTVREGGWSWCTVREGGVELVYSWRGRGGAGVQLEREGRSWCTVLVYS